MTKEVKILQAAEVGPVAAPRPLEGRSFLLVTMPSGPFGRHLGRSLKAAGAAVRRVLLNGGDFISWGMGDALWPRVPRPLWQAWIGWQIEAHDVTDVVVFGDTMTFNAEALAAAREKGARTWVLENGYSRPDWITLEPTGVNANSCTPRDPRAYDDVDLSTPMPEQPHIGTITPYHVVNIISYFTGVIVVGAFFPTYRYPYQVRIWPQILGHTKRYAVSLSRRARWDLSALKLAAGHKPFFLACLQREGDSQLLKHSPVKTNQEFMDRVISSFAAHAPPGVMLAFKNHPLDPGVENLEAACREIAAKYSVSDRVKFLEGGAFATLARASLGVVAVNSTAAYAAMGFGTPVKLLGSAVFDIEGMVHSAPLETFWTAPQPPDEELFARFRRHLSTHTQVYGSYHNPKHLRATADRVTEAMVRRSES